MYKNVFIGFWIKRLWSVYSVRCCSGSITQALLLSKPFHSHSQRRASNSMKFNMSSTAAEQYLTPTLEYWQFSRTPLILRVTALKNLFCRLWSECSLCKYFSTDLSCSSCECFPGGGSVSAALHLPWGGVSVSWDGGAGPGRPQSCFPG